MSILTSVSDGLTLLVSGAAMATAARALWLASAQRRTQPATPAGNGAAASHPAAEPAPATPPATSQRRRTTSNGSSGQGRGNQTREQVRAFLAERAGSDWSLVQVSQGVGRSSATVSYTLDKLIEAGEVELTSPKPRRYTITTSGTAIHQTQPRHQEAQTEPVAAPEPTPAGDRQATATRSSRTRPPADVPATGGTAGNGGGRQDRGAETREQVRAFLADPERAGKDWSLVQVSQGVGRSSATVSYTLDKLVQAGEVELTSPKPRRYTIAASGTAPAEATGQPAEPTREDATGTVSAPAVAAQARPGRTRGRRAAAAEAETSTAPVKARAATPRTPKGGNRKATAAAAMRKASTKPAATTAAK
jgi:hypothetical protein